MEHSFWKNKWDENQIGFHQSDFNPMLVKHFPTLGLGSGDFVFVPLCGKTKDMVWLRRQGYQVVGCELVEDAVIQFFDEIGETPDVTDLAPLKKYASDNYTIWVGDIFELGHDLLGPIHGVFDRAATVALPAETRTRYASHVIEITSGAPQLILTFEYDQSLMDGPPFSVTTDELKRHFGTQYRHEMLESVDMKDGLKGMIPAQISVSHFVPIPQ